MKPEAKRWCVVAAAACAMVSAQGPIGVFGAGVFLKPVAEDLGFGRGVAAGAIGFANLMSAVAAPVFGLLIDRMGVRGPLVASVLLYAGAIAALALTPPSVLGLYLLFALGGFVGIGANPGAYSKVISAWFDRQRGLALGVALAGVGLGTALIPRIANGFIGAFGWRGGYVGLAGLILVVAFLPTLLFVREPTATEIGWAGVGDATPADLPGASLRQAVRDRRFWLMIIGFFVAVVAINGSLVHVVPLLTDRGMPRGQAVAVISASGIALIIGRVFAGWVIDRVFAPYVAIFFFLCPLVGLLVLALQPAAVPPAVGVILLGLGIGAEMDLLSYLTTRYFGVRSFGAIYGWMFTAALLGNAVGSTVLGLAYQLTHAYEPALLAYGALLALAAVLVACLGPYAYPPGELHIDLEREEATPGVALGHR